MASYAKRLTNEKDFPVPIQPQSGNRPQSATMGSANSHQLTRKGKSMAIVFVGIDLAKNALAGLALWQKHGYRLYERAATNQEQEFREVFLTVVHSDSLGIVGFATQADRTIRTVKRRGSCERCGDATCCDEEQPDKIENL